MNQNLKVTPQEDLNKLMAKKMKAEAWEISKLSAPWKNKSKVIQSGNFSKPKDV